MTALMDLGGSYDPCDCECDDCTRAAEAILAMPEMQAIRELLAYVATSYARSGVDIFSAANVPDSVRQWVNP